MSKIENIEISNYRIIEKSDQRNFRGGGELGGYCCALYLEDPPELVGCEYTAVWGECPSETGEGFYYVNVSCYSCEGIMI